MSEEPPKLPTATGGEIELPTNRRLTTKIYVIAWYQRARAALKSPAWWGQILAFVIFWVAVGWPLFKDTKKGILYVVLVALGASARAWAQATPKLMQLVRDQYFQRKMIFYRLLKRMQFQPTWSVEEVQNFQREALWLIASYVRGHRADWQASEIFVNLVVAEGDEVVVIARDMDHRTPLARYPKAGMFVWQVIKKGVTATTGDLAGDYPASPSKPYKSILAIPVQGEGCVLGAVSIDSARAHHFDLEALDLGRGLAPYICLLAWTLAPERVPLRALPKASTSTEEPHHDQ